MPRWEAHVSCKHHSQLSLSSSGDGEDTDTRGRLAQGFVSGRNIATLYLLYWPFHDTWLEEHAPKARQQCAELGFIAKPHYDDQGRPYSHPGIGRKFLLQNT